MLDGPPLTSEKSYQLAYSSMELFEKEAKTMSLSTQRLEPADGHPVDKYKNELVGIATLGIFMVHPSSQVEVPSGTTRPAHNWKR